MTSQHRQPALLAAVLLTMCAGCGDDDGNATTDATNNTTDAAADATTNDAVVPRPDAAICATDLAPIDDGSGNPADLVLSEIAPGSYIELYNTTDAAIALSGVNHQLCSPFRYRSLSVLAPEVTVPAKGFALVAWPSNFQDVQAGGEVILYKDGAFDVGASVLDFVCWGTNPHGSRKALAESMAAGKWSGGCAPALTGGAIHRNMASAGTGAADYDVTSAGSPTNCVQP